MYESHFLFSQRPFTPAPRVEAYIPTGSLEQARQTLVRCIERSEGPGLVIGPAGTGKSLLCHVLASHFHNRLQVAHLAGARLSTRRALLQNILFELKLPFRDMDEGELRLSLIDHLEPRSGGPDGLLLLVDEAHSLPLRLLEEIRLLTNVVRDGQSRVRLVLAGNMALEERLTNPKLESFHQRVAARCYLQPLGRDETIYDVQEQIRRCGGSADAVFVGDAQATIHTATDGIPRLINQVCDHALMLAALGRKRQIDESGVDEAWADLQQLPLPVHESPLRTRSVAAEETGIIEFGQLNDVPTIVAGSIGPELGNLTVANLDSISRTIDTLHNDAIGHESLGTEMAIGDGLEAFSPAPEDGTEVELFFHGAHDPFGGQWEEEEVVLDRYASLHDTAVRSQRVTSDEGRAMGAAISAMMKPSQSGSVQLGPTVIETAANVVVEPQIAALEEEFCPADDPLLPEEAVTIESIERTLRTAVEDDRDLLVIDEGQPSRPAIPAGRPRRMEYRQLFSRMRGK
jgi:type II secretory pathway predicted ATPase ExeA